MKEVFKKILRSAGVYHPLQSGYRAVLTFIFKQRLRSIYRKHKGKGFICNVCLNSYSKFHDDHPSSENRNAISKYNVIAGYGENILCPYCLSTARERLVIAMLSGKDLKGRMVLHLSPEKNVYNFISRQASVITADVDPGYYKPVDRNIEKQDATHLTYKDNSFDMVIGNHILEHIKDDLFAMKEIYRVLKTGGTAILQVPYSESINETFEDASVTTPELRSLHFGQKDHVRIYKLQDYIHRLQRTGFAVQNISYKRLQELYPYAIQQNESFLTITKPFTS